MIPDGRQVSGLPDHQPHQAVLDRVHVLDLVHDYMSHRLAQCAQCVGMALEQSDELALGSAEVEEPPASEQGVEARGRHRKRAGHWSGPDVRLKDGRTTEVWLIRNDPSEHHRRFRPAVGLQQLSGATSAE